MKEGIYYPCVDDFWAANKDSKTKKILLVAEYTNFELKYLEKYQGEIVGAIVPFVVYNNEFYNKGIISCDLHENNNLLLIEDLKNFSIEKSFFANTQSLVVLIDGLSSNISDFLDNLFENIPENTQVIGGGAGKMTLEQEPVIFSKTRILKDAAVVISLKSKLFLGIEIGWEYLEGPFLITNSEKNVLKTLNFKNAFEVYKEVVEKDSGMKFEDDNFFDIAKSYPLGIIKYDKEIVVRDPILIDKNNNMVLVGDIPHHSTINILKGKAENLIKSSGNAIKKAMEQLDCEQNENSVILFDCISRSIFLGDDFVKELEEIAKQMKPSKNLFGALTLGEIANNGNEYITFYNKTCVIGVLC
jgi:hypothetical protein